MRTVLVTGAAGGIGTRLRKLLKGVYPQVRWSDIRPPLDLSSDETFVQADLADLAQVEPCRVRTPGRSTPGLGHPQPFPLDAGDERRDAGKLGRRVNRGRDLRNGVAEQPGAILCRHSNVLDCPAETVPQAVEI